MIRDKDENKKGLKYLLSNPDSYQGEKPIIFSSKTLDYPGMGKAFGWGQGPLLGKRAHWDITDPNAEPTLYNSWDSNEGGRDHGESTLIDAYIRGGISVNDDRRKIDYERIKKFLYSTPEGEQFLMTQTEIPGSSGVSQPFRGGGIASLRRY